MNEETTTQTAVQQVQRQWRSETAAKPNVLIVDDDVALARILSFVLGQEGFDVTIANDGDAAIEMAKASRPDAIVLDLRMPGKDGRAVFRELRELSIDSPVLILSAFDARQASVELGAQAYMNKPFEPEHLAAAVHRLLEEQS